MSENDKTIGLLGKLQAVLLRSSLVTFYKSFRRPHLDYGDNIYSQAYKESFHQKLESRQYNASLTIKRLQKQRWYRKRCYFLKNI